MILWESQEIKYKSWYVREDCSLLGLVKGLFIDETVLSGQ